MTQTETEPIDVYLLVRYCDQIVGYLKAVKRDSRHATEKELLETFDNDHYVRYSLIKLGRAGCVALWQVSEDSDEFVWSLGDTPFEPELPQFDTSVDASFSIV